MPIDQPVDVDGSPKRRNVWATRCDGRTQNSAEFIVPGTDALIVPSELKFTALLTGEPNGELAPSVSVPA